MEHLWDGWRAANMLLAILALAVTLRKFRGRWQDTLLQPGLLLGVLGLLLWCIGYAVTGVYASLAGGDPGPWTAVMTFPIVYTLVSGLIPLDYTNGDRG